MKERIHNAFTAFKESKFLAVIKDSSITLAGIAFILLCILANLGVGLLFIIGSSIGSIIAFILLLFVDNNKDQ